MLKQVNKKKSCCIKSYVDPETETKAWVTCTSVKSPLILTIYLQVLEQYVLPFRHLFQARPSLFLQDKGKLHSACFNRNMAP